MIYKAKKLQIVRVNRYIVALNYLSNEYTAYHTSNTISTNGGRFTKLEIYGTLSFALITNIEDIDLILDFLCDVEHYINRHIDDRKEIRYSIAYLGRVFIGNGGYTAKFLAEDAERKLNEAEVERMKRVDLMGLDNQSLLNKLTSRLVWGTWIAGLGTGFLALIELVKLCCPHIFENLCL